VLEGDTDKCKRKDRRKDIGCGQLHKVFNEEQECSWYGKTATFMTWEFEFLNDFRFKDCPGCTCEYIEFFDGRNSSSESLGRFCGSTKPDDVSSSGKYVSFIIKAGKTSEVHFKFKGTFSKKIMAGLIGGLVGALFLCAACLWCWWKFCCTDDDTDDNATDPTTDRRENNKETSLPIHQEYQLDENLTAK